MSTTPTHVPPGSGGRTAAAGDGAPGAGTAGTLAEAMRLHRGGRLQQAEAIYRRTLDADPDHAEALHLLGVVAHQQGRHGAAADLIAKAVAVDPNHAKAHVNLGVALAAGGELDAAVAAYRKAIALDADQAAGHFNLGVALARLGKLDEAVAAYREAVAVDPGYAEAHANIGAVLKNQGKLDEAVACCRRAIARDPKLAGAHFNLGLALKAQDKLDEAIAAYREAIALAPDYAEAHTNLGVALRKHGDLDDAIAAHRKAIALKPDYAEAHTNLGVALRHHGDLDEAIAAHREAIALNPDNPEAYFNLGRSLREADQIEDALVAFDRALDIDPGHADARFSRALLHILRGNFAAGWRDYRARPGTRHAQGKFHGDPLGRQLAGKRVLVLMDQGLGDEIFFLRFAPQFNARGASIAYHADPKIADMVARLPFIDQVVGRDDEGGPFDHAAYVGDLPYLLGMTDASDIPPSIELPVLPERLAEMRGRLAGLGPPPHIGVTWRAGTQHKPNLLSKAAPLERLAAALRPIGGTVVIVQRNPAGGEIEAFADMLGRDAHDFTALNDDLEGMLALVDLLDDYACVSNLNVQLRAARGGASRVLIPHPPEFRWMASGEESPWFPGTRVYRQTVAGSWDEAFGALGSDLASAWPDS